MMKKFLYFLLSLCFSGTLSAQTIKGYVLSAKDRTPVEFANVAILNLPDSSLAKGVITYTDGQYSVPGLKPGSYFIKATYVGMVIERYEHRAQTRAAGCSGRYHLHG